jgi:putative oxidoreductase
MKIATIIIRLLLGALLLFASLSFFFHLVPEPDATGNMKIFNEGLMASGYLMTLVKIVELVCGLSFVTGKFLKLTPILLMPISINILLVHIFMMPEGIPVALFVFLGNLFLIYKNWEHYKDLFAA